MTLKQIAKKHLATWPLYDAENHQVLTRSISGGKYLGYLTHLYDYAHRFTRFDVNVLHGVFYVLDIRIDASKRGKGHGDALYNVLESIGRDAGCSRIQMTPSGWTHTGESRMDYMLRRGYREFGTEVVKDLV